MKITAIKYQVKNPNRVSVYVDGAYAFSFTQDQLLEQKIHNGQEVDEPRLESLKKVSEFGKAYARVLNYLAVRPRSTKEVKDYCWRKHINAEDCQAIVERLMSRGHIDDQSFARVWVDNRQLTKHASRRRLQQELKQKGIDDETITQVLDGGYDELAALRELIAKKNRQARYKDPQKLTQYLLRQGFRYSDIQAAMAE